MTIKTINNGHDTFYAVAIMHGNDVLVNLVPEVSALLKAEHAYYTAMNAVKTVEDALRIAQTDYTSAARKAYEDALRGGRALYAVLYGED